MTTANTNSFSSMTLGLDNKSYEIARNSSELSGRILLAAIFLMSGIGKIAGYTATAGYMDSVGVRGDLLPIVIGLEILGALAIIVGWQTRVAAILLAGFTLASAVLFHNNFADQIEMIMFMKNISITGGFLILVANGAGAYSLDARTARKAGNPR